VTGEIGAGLMILLGVGREDTSAVASSMAEKVREPANFRGRCGKDEPVAAGRERRRAGRFAVTLYGDARGQRRPSFIAAAPPEQAKPCMMNFVRRSACLA